MPQAAPGPFPGDEDEPQATTLDLRARLKARRFNFAIIPKPVIPRYSIGHVPGATPGNLAAISTGVKNGKSSFVGAMVAATRSGGGDACLGVRSTNPDNGAVIHLHTEQCREDHDTIVRQAVRRAALKKPPPWLMSYFIAGFSVPDAQEAVRTLLADAKAARGSIHLLLIDGAADLVPDVNNPEVSNAFVAELHSFAIAYECPIICVIHLNPGGDKTRGHLGPQIERKAESNIRLQRDGDAIVVWSDKNRKSPTSKGRGPRFVWALGSEILATGLPVSSLTPAQHPIDRRRAFFENQVMNRTMLGIAAGLTLLWGMASAGEKASPPKGWKLVWQDEFKGRKLDSKKWNVLLREHSKHNELQFYVPDEVFVTNGCLRLRSQIRDYGSMHYTSGRLDTRGKFSPIYGRFEIRAKLPGGKGLWPAHWLYPQNRNYEMEYLMAEAVANGRERLIPEERPWYSEIDIMEFLGHEPTVVYGTLHYYTFDGQKRTSSGTWRGNTDVTRDFHLYVLEWEPGELRWFIDGQLIHKTTDGIPHTPHYLILNTAVGGAWPGNPDATTVFPQFHDIDYVRVYQRARYFEH